MSSTSFRGVSRSARSAGSAAGSAPPERTTSSTSAPSHTRRVTSSGPARLGGRRELLPQRPHMVRIRGDRLDLEPERLVRMQAQAHAVVQPDGGAHLLGGQRQVPPAFALGAHRGIAQQRGDLRLGVRRRVEQARLGRPGGQAGAPGHPWLRTVDPAVRAEEEGRPGTRHERGTARRHPQQPRVDAERGGVERGLDRPERRLRVVGVLVDERLQRVAHLFEPLDDPLALGARVDDLLEDVVRPLLDDVRVLVVERDAPARVRSEPEVDVHRRAPEGRARDDERLAHEVPEEAELADGVRSRATPGAWSSISNRKSTSLSSSRVGPGR